MRINGCGAGLLVAAVLAWVAAPAAQEVGAGAAETSARWFVELSSPPTADGTSLTVVQAEKDAFRTAARRASLRYAEVRSFDVLWNGLVVAVAPRDVAALARVQGVRAIYPVLAVEREPIVVGPDQPDLTTAVAMTGADIAQSELGFTGAGVKVGIIDSGLDYHHPAFGGCFGPGCRVAYGYDFVGNAFDGTNTPVPDPDPDTACDAHGTHVAGIVGANGAVKGVAPDVTLGAYRVFGCGGTTTTDLMIAAMERALADGMQVVNMSIGSTRQWPQYPSAQAGTRLVDLGVVVTASMGNSASIGLYGGSAPGIGTKTIGVASVENTAIHQSAFAVSPDGRLVGYNNATGAPPAPLSGDLPLARTGTTTSTADACAALPAGSLSGMAALIRRGTCSFYIKSRNAELAGAAAVVLYNNVAGALNITVAGSPAVTIPVVSITAADGALIDGRIQAGPTTLTWTDQTVSSPNPAAGQIATTSSWGVGQDLALKPDVSAPGGNIRSTVPIELGSYATLSGTSMSAPHAAGAAALILQAHPTTPAQAMGAILQNSADPGSRTTGVAGVEAVHRQGAGLIDIDDAILATTRITPGKLSLGETEAGPITRTLTIVNKAAWPVTYALSHTPALATTPATFTATYIAAAADVAFGTPSVTVPANGSADVWVTVTPPAGLADRSLFGGFIVFTPDDGGQVYRVPYAAFKGDYQSIRALEPTASGLPWLARLVAGNYVNQPSGATFTLAGTDVPTFLVHLDHGVRRLRFEVFEADSGRAWHRALEEPYVARNSSATGFYAVPWDGVTVNGTRVQAVPDGRYVMVISVLKALGDPANPAHWESWTSPVVTIDRP